MPIRYKFDCVIPSFEGVVSVRSIDRSDPRPLDPSSLPPSIASPKRGRRNHRHLLSVCSRTDNLLARSTRSTIISRPSVCRQRISTEGTGQPRKTVRDIYSPGGYPRIVSVNRGEVLALLGQLQDRIERSVSYRRQAFAKNEQTGHLLECLSILRSWVKFSGRRVLPNDPWDLLFSTVTFAISSILLL